MKSGKVLETVAKLGVTALCTIGGLILSSCIKAKDDETELEMPGETIFVDGEPSDENEMEVTETEE